MPEGLTGELAGQTSRHGFFFVSGDLTGDLAGQVSSNASLTILCGVSLALL